MTHVFVAPHPDDVALSCGGLIASLRELGQNVTIVTVFSGNGADDGPDALPARGARLRLEGACGRRPRRSTAPASCPTYPIWPAWLADEDGLEATQVEADAAAKRFWQRSSWYRRASIRAESLAGQPVIDDLPTQGARPDRRRRRRGRGRRPDGPATARGRALRLLRRGVGGLPRPARRGLPRLRGRRPTARRAPSRRHGAVRPPAPGDRPAGAAEGLPAARRRRPRRPSALPRRRASRCSTRAGAG